MRNWIFFLFFFVLDSVQAQQIKFSQSKALLSLCIESYLLKDPKFQMNDNAKLIAEISSENLCGKVLNSSQFFSSNSAMFHIMEAEGFHLFGVDIRSKEIKNAIESVLENCVERQNLPRFSNEQPKLTELLDYILVDWPTPLDAMIGSQNGRAVLRRYAYDVEKRLSSALTYFSNNRELFRRELEETWMQRAQQYFDGHSQRPYIRHRFTTNRDRTYTSTELAEIHTLDYVVPQEFQNITRQTSLSLTLFEYHHLLNQKRYYLETHIEQCYRILFYMLELQAIGIETNEDDTYFGSVPDSLLPEYTQKMVYDDRAYQDHLSLLRANLEVFRRKEFGVCFSGGSEEDIIMVRIQSIAKKKFPSTTTETILSTTKTASTTLSYQQGPKKGGVREKGCGKYFLPNKRLRTVDSELNQQTQQSSSQHYLDINNEYGATKQNNQSGFPNYLDINHVFSVTEQDQLYSFQYFLDANNVNGTLSSFYNVNFQESVFLIHVLDGMLTYTEL